MTVNLEGLLCSPECLVLREPPRGLPRQARELNKLLHPNHKPLLGNLQSLVNLPKTTQSSHDLNHGSQRARVQQFRHVLHSCCMQELPRTLKLYLGGALDYNDQ